MDGIRLRRQPLKTHHPNWKEKLRENCLKRVQEERTNLLWRIRSNGGQVTNEKEMSEFAFRSIVTDELEKIKVSSLSACQGILLSKSSDVWQYDGPCPESNANEIENEELLIEMERLLYEDLREEIIRRELEACEEEDEYLARAVFEHMQLNDDQKGKIWCPICKRGELRETHHLIYCTDCKLRLDLETDKVNLEFMRDRLGEVHMEHLDRGCKATPTFSMETVFNLTALYIKCQTCNTLEVVV